MSLAICMQQKAVSDLGLKCQSGACSVLVLASGGECGSKEISVGVPSCCRRWGVLQCTASTKRTSTVDRVLRISQISLDTGHVLKKASKRWRFLWFVDSELLVWEQSFKNSMQLKDTVLFNRNLQVSLGWRFHILMFIAPQPRPIKWLLVYNL